MPDERLPVQCSMVSVSSGQQCTLRMSICACSLFPNKQACWQA